MENYIFDNRQYQMVMTSLQHGKQPEEGTELFVKNIPKDVRVQELTKYFEQVGKLFEVKLMVKSEDENRGFAYVCYLKKNDATNAIRFLPLMEFRKGVHLKIKASYNNRRIFLGNIATQKTKDELWKELNKVGYSNIVDVIMYKSYSNSSTNRGYAFVELKTHEMAASFRARAVNRLILWGRPIIVDWAVPYPEPTEETMKQVKKIFLRNLDVLLTTDELRQILYTLILGFKIEKVYKFKNYAFIHLATRKDAEDLFEKLSDYYKDTTVEVAWAKPQSYLTSPEYRQNKVKDRGNQINKRRQSSINIEDEFYVHYRHLLGDLLDELDK